MNVQSNSIDEMIAANRGVSGSEASESTYEVSLIDVLTQLAYGKVLIAKVTGAAVLLGLVVAFVLPVRYTATTKIMPPQQTQSTATMLMSQLTGLGGSSLAAMAGSGLGLKNPNDIYVGLLTSRPIADVIIQRFGLQKEYRAKDMTASRKKLAEFTDVTSEKNGFIAISVTDKDKGRAAEMANTYTEELRTLTKTLAVTEASQRRIFYEDQLKQSRDALVAAALAVQQVQQQKGLIQLDAQAKAMIEGLATIRAQVAAKQVEVQALRSYSTEQNPEVQLAEKELASLQSEEAQLEQNNHGSGIAGLGLGNVPSAGLEYLHAEHELQYRQALNDMLMKQFDAAKLDESKDAAVIQVLEPAIEPDQKSSPKRAMLVSLFTIVGFCAGCMLVLIFWWWEYLQLDPITAQRIEELQTILTGRKAAKA
jgi:tyrosine-protein kinase Etk/Wzc